MRKPVTNLQAFIKALPYLEPLQGTCIIKLSKRFNIPQSALKTLCDRNVGTCLKTL